MTTDPIYLGVRLDSRAAYAEPELARALGLRIATLRAARLAGALRGIRLGRGVIYLGSDVARWLGASPASSEEVTS
jgi:hypothetical protein